MPSQPTTSHDDCWLECVPKSSCPKCTELENITKQLDAAEQTARDLRARRAVLIAAVTARRDPVTAKLPFELVAQIFEQYVYMHDTDPDGYRYPLYPEVERPPLFRSIYPSAPLRLGAVCRLWRRIAWVHPQLWTTLDILLTIPVMTSGDMVSEWLSRTSTLPLSIRVHHPADLIDHDDDEAMDTLQINTRQIMAAINRHASQWRCLDFSEVPLDIVSKLDDTHCTSADRPSMLQRISIGDSLSSVLRDSNRNLFKTRRTHHPTHLHILATLRPDKIPIEWMRITHIHVESMNWMAFYTVLLLAQRKNAPLTHLSAACVFEGVESWSPGNAIVELASLTSLTIEEDGMSHMTTQGLFKRLKAPSLQFLKYSGWEDIPTPVNELIKVVKRSKCTIQTLHLVGPMLSDEDLIRLLQAMPSIKDMDLRLYADNNIESLLDALSQANFRTRKPPLLPRLARLRIQALAPDNWASLVGILADNPSVLDDELPPPLREGLRIDFTITSAGALWSPPGGVNDPAQMLDKVSLLKLGQLYRKYGISCVIKPEWDNGKGVSFLLASLRLHFPDIEMSSSDNPEYQNLLAMSKAADRS